MGTPMLVDSDWLDRANAALNALGLGTETGGASTPASPGTASRFYDVRPARIVGEWSRNDAGLWTAKANFIVGDAVDASFEFDVAAPLAFESETAPTAADATAFVVWRGRWELLTGSLNLATTRVMSGFSRTTNSYVTSLGDPETVDVVANFEYLPDTVNVVTAVGLYDENGNQVYTTGKIPIVTEISANEEGYLTVTTAYLGVTKQGIRAVDTLKTTKVAVLSGYPNVAKAAAIQAFSGKFKDVYAPPLEE